MKSIFYFADTLHYGKRFFCSPITMVALWKHIDNQNIVKAEFTVSKRIMKKAVHRNRAKRQMRASYSDIIKNFVFMESVHLIFFYSDKTEQPFNIIKAAMLQNIRQFCLSLTENYL